MSVLEENVGKLLRRAYVPALPAPEFRARLQAVFGSELERLIGPHAPTRAASGARAPRPHVGRILRRLQPVAAWTVAAAAAALLLVVLLRERPGGPGGSEGSGEDRLSGQGGEIVAVPTPATGSAVTDDRPDDQRDTDPLATLDEGTGGRQPVEEGSGTDTSLTAVPESAAGGGPVLLGSVRIEGEGEGESGGPASAAAIDTVRLALLPPRLADQNGYPQPIFCDLALAEGSFRWELEGAPPGSYQVFVHAEGFALARAGEVVIAEGDAEVAIEATLERGGTLRGQVIDAENEIPLAGAWVVSERDLVSHVLPYDEKQLAELWMPAATRTGPDGRFEITGLSSGPHVLRASAPEHAPRWLEEDVRADGVPAPLTFKLGPDAILRGRVSRDDGSPWQGAFLIISLMEQVERPQMNFGLTFTDAEGRYEVRSLPPQPHLAILIGDPAAQSPPRVLPAILAAGEVAEVNFGEEAQGCLLTGTVTGSDGKPVTGHNLGLIVHDEEAREPSWVATTTDAGGRYAFENVAPGDYDLYLIGSMGNALRWIGEVAVPDLAEHRRDVELAQTELSGRLADGREGPPSSLGAGSPVAGAFVMCEIERPGRMPWFAGFTFSDSDGRYSFGEIPEGTYAVIAYPLSGDLGFATRAGVEVRAGATSTCDLAHLPGGAIHARVVDPEGQPVAGAWIDFEDEIGKTFTFDQMPSTDGEGVYLAERVRAGVYRVRAEREGYDEASARVDCLEGATAEVELVLRPRSPGGASSQPAGLPAADDGQRR